MSENAPWEPQQSNPEKPAETCESDRKDLSQGLSEDLAKSPEDTELEQINKKEGDYKKAAKTYIDNLMANGESAKGHEKDEENLAIGYLEYVKSFENYIKLIESGEIKNPKKTNMIGIAIVANDNSHSKISILEIPSPIPESSQLMRDRIMMAENGLLQARHDYYTKTGDESYRKYFEEDIEKKGRYEDIYKKRLIDSAESDGEGAKKELPRLQKDIEDVSEEYKRLLSTAAESPENAYSKGLELHKKLSLLWDKSEDTKQYTRLNSAYVEAISFYMGQVDAQVINNFTNNRYLSEYSRDVAFYSQQTNGFAESLQKLFSQIQNGETPTDYFMQKVREEAERTLNNPLREKLINGDSEARRFIKGLKKLEGNDEFTKRINKIQDALQKQFEANSEYLKEITILSIKIQTVKGSSYDWESLGVEVGKYLVVLAAATAAAVAIGALVAATGGVAIPGLLGVAANLGIQAGAAGLASTIASRYTQAAIEGDTKYIDDSADMAVSIVQSSAVNLGAGILGQAVGTAGGALLGKVANKSEVFRELVGKRLQELLIKRAAALNTAAATATKATKGTLGQEIMQMIKEIGEETGEEITEDMLQKIGEGMAPDYPMIGFAMQFLPSMIKAGKGKFLETTGTETFTISNGVTAKLSKNKINLEYTNKDSAVEVLKKMKVPDDKMQEFIDKKEIAMVVKDANGEDNYITMDPSVAGVSAEGGDLATLTREEETLLHDLFPYGLGKSPIEQLNTGNCYYLAFYNALISHPAGKNILMKMVKTDSKGNFIVTFPGNEPIYIDKLSLDGQVFETHDGKRVVKKTAKGQYGDNLFEVAFRMERMRRFTKEIVKTESGWSVSFHKKGTTDIETIDVTKDEVLFETVRLPGQGIFKNEVEINEMNERDRIIEVAHRKLVAKNAVDGKARAIEEGGFSDEPTGVFLDRLIKKGILRGTKTPEGRTEITDILNKFAESPRSFILTAGTDLGSSPDVDFVDPGKKILTQHAYTVGAVDSQRQLVTLIDPHNTGTKRITVTYNEFFNYFSSIEGAELDTKKLEGIDGMQKTERSHFDFPLQPQIPHEYDVSSPIEIQLARDSLICYKDKSGTVVVHSNKTGEDIRLKPGDETVIGKKSLNMSDTVNDLHVKIEHKKNGKILITDLNSTYGTRVRKQ